MRITFNVLAFFFGPIYFAVKGMWRKALSRLGMNLTAAVMLVPIDAPTAISTPVGAAFAGLTATAASDA
ncbi:DUF2628 domain-containing protein [Gordonia sp. VNK21]|uniref:DUF2628 domain-containing protein n=1 Tax=Gordonia sp. VNK21 TaxID=3382483 RepID=UPI0038D4C32B